MRPSIFFDFDETIFPHTPLARQFVKEHYDVELPADFHAGMDLRKFVNENSREHPNIDAHTFWTHYADTLLCSSEAHRALRPIRGAEDVIPVLADRYELWLVTARQEICKPVVEMIVDEFFPDCFKDMHFVWMRTPLGYVERKKCEFIADIGNGIAFFDDSPHEIMGARHVVRSVLFDQYGHHADHPEITDRVSSWEEIGEILLS